MMQLIAYRGIEFSISGVPKAYAKPMNIFRFKSVLKNQAGVTLVELLIAMLLGLFVSGSILSLFYTSTLSYQSNEQMARTQENARYAYEVLTKEIREAGGIPCGSVLKIGNTINDSSTRWWSNWEGGIRGYESGNVGLPWPVGTAVGERVVDTDAVVIQGVMNNEFTSWDKLKHTVGDAQFEIPNASTLYSAGEIMMVCDDTQAAIFQINDVATDYIDHHYTGSVVPGNCTLGLGHGTDCSEADKNTTSIDLNVRLARYQASAWFLAKNSRGKKSLFKATITPGLNTVQEVVEEIADGVSDLQLEYLLRTATGDLALDYVDATSVTDWSQVVAVRMVVTSEADAVIDNEPIKRNWYTVISLRNRIQ